MKHCLVILSLLLAASYVKAQTTTQPLMKYQNKKGISLNFTPRNDGITNLVREVIQVAVNLIDEDKQKAKEFLKENFDIEDKNE